MIAAAEIGRDITARKLAEQRVAYLAYHDDLTGLPNRLMFAEHLDLALARAQRHGRGSPCSTSTSTTSSTRTTPTGTRRATSCCARSPAGSSGRRGRPIWSPATAATSSSSWSPTCRPDASPGPREIAQTIAEHVEQALAAPAAIDGATITAGGSVGIALYPDDATDRDELLRRADAAMYRSKERAERMPPAAGGTNGAAQVPLTARMQLALERGEFVLHYQPILRLDDMRMVGVEALIRWNHPDDGLLAPSAFIPLAERTDLITAISDWVIDEVCRASRPWVLGEMNIQAAVNLPIARWHPDAGRAAAAHHPRERPRTEPDRGRGERVERDDRPRSHAGRSCTTCTATASSSRSTTSAQAIRRSAA